MKGHQDDNANAVLDRWALLNIRMDSELIVKKDRQLRIYGEPWRVWIDGCKVATELSDKLINRIEGSPCIQYWAEKGGFGTL